MLAIPVDPRNPELVEREQRLLLQHLHDRRGAPGDGARDGDHRLIDAQRAHQAADEERKKNAELITSAEGLIYSTEQTLQEYGESLEEQDLELIKNDLSKLKASLQSNDTESIQKSYKDLETSAYRIAETIYAQE